MTVQLSGQIGVAAGLAAGNVLQRLPDPLLKGRAANVQGQMGGSLGFFELLQHLLQPAAQTLFIFFELGGGEALLQLAA